MEPNWIGLVLVALGLYLAFKLIGAALRLLMWALVLVGAYWFTAPLLGWPTVSDLVYVFGPDLGGQRIEEVLTPSRMADALGERVVDGMVDGVMEGVRERLQAGDPAPADGGLPQPLPEPLPEPLPAEAAGDAPDAEAGSEAIRTVEGRD
ncbi:MAG TPA: hypothetical protein H9827_04780 [Candidatus Luteimonas excrementigallinarum]|nr:hypothetical protein [Candidatus Luteimonas excrementigallinarum]